MRRAILAMAVLALAACQEADPQAASKRACDSEDSDPTNRIGACTTLLEEGGEMEEADRAAALAHRGSAQLKKGEPTAALADFRAALGIDENNTDAMIGHADILVASGQLDAAAPILDRLIAAGEHVARAHALKGDIALVLRDRDSAISEYNSALSAEPRMTTVLASRARAKQDNGDLDGAFADYNSAISADGDNVPARAGRCWNRIMREEDNLGPARADAERAVDIDPRFVRAQLCLGLVMLREREWDRARTAYDAVLAIEPGNPTALFGRGVARRRSEICRAMRIWIARGISTRASPIRSRIWVCVPTRPAPPSRTSHARLRRQGLRPLSRGRARHWS